MSITQNISEITPLSAFTSPNRPAEVDNLVENELPNLTQELGLLIPQINETIYQASLAAQNTEASKNIATTQAGIATTKASEANTSANQSLIYKNQVMGYVVPIGASYSVEQINTQNVAMTKAQFNALAEERKSSRAGSGFENFGKGSSTTSVNVNEGIWTDSTQVNKFYLGKTTSNSGTSITPHSETMVNGILQKLKNLNNSSLALAEISLPTAPNIYPHDTVLTTEQIASGVIKHADSSNSGLIVNGKFDIDTSGWTNHYPASTIESIGGMLKATNVGGAYAGARTIIPTIIGKTYIMEVDTGVFSGASIIYGIGTAVGTDNIKAGGFGNSNQKYKVEFTATSTTTHILVRTYNNTAGNYMQIDNIAVYPLDAISRSDLSIAESWHEDSSEKNIVYPLGNIQYLGANTDGLTGITNGAFTGFETYSLFGNWQTSSALIGKGYVWSSLTEAQKKAFISNSENNCYLDGDKTIQVRYRVRVAMGLGDNWDYPVAIIDGGGSDPVGSTISYSAGTGNKYLKPKGKKVNILNDVTAYNANDTGFFANKNYKTITTSYESGMATAIATNNTTLDTGVAYEGKCFALPIALVHRRNQGMYHPVYNPNGTKKASDGNFWYNTAVSFTSISDCFDPSKLLTASGYIGSVSGRPDGLFYDQVHEGDITDLRNSSKKAEDYNRLINREFNKLVAGTYRGKEGEWQTIVCTQSSTSASSNSVEGSDFTKSLQIGDVVQLNNLNTGASLRVVVGGVYSTYFSWSGGVFGTFARTTGDKVIVSVKSTRTKSNTLLHCDIIGNSTNYPTAWKQSGVFGTPLIVAEDGTSLLPDGVKDSFKLSRKANATPLLCLRSTDSGATWTSFTPIFSTTTNAITLTDEPANNLVMVYYQTKTIMAVPVVNSEVLEIGDVFATNAYDSKIINSMIGKSSTYYYTTTNTFGCTLKFTSVSPIGTSLKLMGSTNYGTDTTHSTHLLKNDTSPAVKVFPYLTRTNGKAYLNLIFKEMKYNGTSWGDDNKFNIVDNVSTTTDNNAQTVLIGQKTVELPYFIGGDE